MTINRIALVTGANGGFGQAICKRLIDDGFFVVGSDRVSDPAVLPVNASAEKHYKYKAADLEDEDEIDRLASFILESYGRCDVLVNNAGVHAFNPDRSKHDVVSSSPDHWKRELSVNLTAPYLLSRALLQSMITNRWGRIVNITSRSGRTGVPFASAGYSASKGGLAAFSRLLAAEVGRHGITVNCVAPGGLIRTPLSEQLPEDAKKWLMAGVVLEREGQPEEIASSVAFFASDDGSYVTGTELDVNGGLYMR
jgi:3-oxoacyl-[acyl-carrier protein] reductase